MDFAQMVHAATGYDPYPYQSRLAAEGLPDLLRAPTGSGKTVAAVLPWLHRRRFHVDEGVRNATPTKLALALPLRTLVEQVESEVTSWLERLDLGDEVGLDVLMGGRSRLGSSLTEHPDRDTILVGSIDMLLSRAMNRGYAANRYRWPLDFGLFNNGVQWVFDEVQLMGPALPTSRQLQAFRESFGTALPVHSMWMSATVAPGWLSTVDAPEVRSTVEISDADRTGPLGERTGATREVRELTDVDATKAESVAQTILREHRTGTRTICMVNTVKAAQELHRQLTRKTETDIVLVHSRFRPEDRAEATEAALSGILPVGGRIVVTTQAFEAGIDISSTTLVTEVGPWTAIVQRAGRCNRYGEAPDARLLWYEPASPAPYEEGAISQSVEALRELEGQRVTGEQLARQTFEDQVAHSVLRRRDLIDLFDTTPNLSGDDIDISPYVRDGDERDLFVGWRSIDGDGPDDEWQLYPTELCRVPVGAAKKWLTALRKVGPAPLWRYDPEMGRWSRLSPEDVRPGITVLADGSAGHYTPLTGWDPTAKKAIVLPAASPGDGILDAATDAAAGDDRLAKTGDWVTLSVHLRDAEHEARQLLDALEPQLSSEVCEAIATAAALHDIGKVHPVFQETLRKSAGDGEQPLPDKVWAKSSRQKRSSHARPHFRHELVSALMLTPDAAADLLPDEADLARYLVAAHHGIVRLAFRPLAQDRDSDGLGRVVALGVVDGEKVPGCDLENGRSIPPTVMPVAEASAMGGEGSWSRLALRLRDREDLGPFRLAWLEAIVRLADWRASANPSETVDVPVSEGRQ